MKNISPFCPKAVLDALKAAPDPKAFIVAELRDMAARNMAACMSRPCRRGAGMCGWRRRRCLAKK